VKTQLGVIVSCFHLLIGVRVSVLYITMLFFNDTYRVKKILKWEHGRVMEHVTPYVLYGLLEMYGGYPHKQKSKEI
jgi:hypothetical protein